MPPVFSVIIPTCRRPELLARALASVLAQDLPDYECVVVDDGGTEPLELPDDPRLRLIRHQENLGLPSALNTGLDAAMGDYVTFLDDDDELTSNRLSMVLPALGASDVVACWASADGPPHPRNRMLDGRVYDTILDTSAPPKGTLVLRRERLPRFDPRYLALEDLEWLLRVTAVFDVTTVPQIGYLVHQHPALRTTNGPVARARCGQLLLREQSDYFRTHRKAAALRLRMVGGIALELGDTKLARHCLVRSMRAHPTSGALKRLVKSIAPSRTSLDSLEPASR